MVETPLDIARCWVEFTDPATEGQRIRADLTWLTSSWGCIFGSGCRGLYAARPDDGCCTLGAHFTDADDLARVAGAVALLTDEHWQYRSAVLPAAGARGKRAATRPGKGMASAADPTRAWSEDEGDTRTTRVVDGACVFLNRPGFPTGPGCALHHYAVSQGEAPHTTKPDVCWQLPIRRLYRDVSLPDGTTYLEVSITEFDRRFWGEGGHDLDWYCSSNSEAHVAREPVYRSQRDELVELMGPAAYEQLVVRCEAHLAAVRSAQRQSKTAMLTLLVHPATLAARG